MEERLITPSAIRRFQRWMIEAEKAPATIEKYLCALRRFAAYADGKPIERSTMLAYKAALGAIYTPQSANAMLAAVHAFLRFLGWGELGVKPFRVQRQPYLPEEKLLNRREYEQLLAAAKRRGNERLWLILQTICATGIRVSELSFITVEAVRAGKAMVRCKGKSREVFLVEKICDLLTEYIQRHGIESGAIFITRSGKPMSRVAIWRDMKGLCREAEVDPQKVFPHNLRHLFARVFYSKDKDLAKLADILGHSSINTTRIYIAESGAEHRRQMERLDLVIDTPMAVKPKPKEKRRERKRA